MHVFGLQQQKNRSRFRQRLGRFTHLSEETVVFVLLILRSSYQINQLKSIKVTSSFFILQAMVQLSVIIVNYNVKYFLEQVLLSVRKASENMVVEVIVVDNNSVDGSVQMVADKFPEVILIANKENTGFSVANNQGIKIAKGKYVLLLNPDTVVEEDTFEQSVAFMEAHPDAGALGVKMYDGKGTFLPESKRGLPTPMVAFYKIFGFGALFPKSKTFNYYYLGHLDNEQVHEIDVLAGAFMLMRKQMLDEEVGYLDETFFMYGEDIDLSYRIIKAGYKNYYYPHTRIIHYKGESTKKGSLNYVKVFYQAMIIFARKHFSAEKAQFYTFCIHIAIYLRAFLSLISGITKQIMAPLLDAALIYGGLFFIKDFWQNNVKAAEGTTYAAEYMLINVPLYIAIWLLSMFLSGSYDKPTKISRVVRGLLVGTLLISAVYGFLPETLRFSRGMIIVGMVWAIFALSAWRLVRHFMKYKSLNFDAVATKRVVIVGSLLESERVQLLLHQAGVVIDLIGYVAPSKANNLQTDKLQGIVDKQAKVHPQAFLGSVRQLKEIVEIYQIEEVIFCGSDISSQQIIQFMIDIGQSIDYKIVPQESLSIIGSNSKNTAGDLYTIDIKLNLNETRNHRNKRVLDVIMSLVLLAASVLLIWVVKHKANYLMNCIWVLLGKKSWVGYATSSNSRAKEQVAPRKNIKQQQLPPIKQGVLSPLNTLKKQHYDEQTIYRLNLLYAKDYTANSDLYIIWKGVHYLGTVQK